MCARTNTCKPAAVVLMGVSGVGKSTVGRLLACSLKVPFLEGDEYHPPRNLEKMRSAIALEDGDRWPWLEILGRAIGRAAASDGLVVATCSALKRSYRESLSKYAAVPMLFVCLRANRALLEARLRDRSGHFMPESLLDSQCSALEQPAPSECALCVDAAIPVAELVEAVASSVKKWLRL